MDLLSITRTLGGLALVLGLLWGALWLVRRYDIQLPGRTGMARRTRLELVERLALDARRSVALVRRDGQQHLILIAPEGHLLIESGIVTDALPETAAPDDASASVEPDIVAENPLSWTALPGEGFGALVEKVRLCGVPVAATPVRAATYQPARRTRARRRHDEGAVHNG